MEMEAHASKKGQTTTQGSAMPRAPDIRDEEESGAESGSVGAREALGGYGESPHVVIGECRRAIEGIGQPLSET